MRFRRSLLKAARFLRKSRDAVPVWIRLLGSGRHGDESHSRYRDAGPRLSLDSASEIWCCGLRSKRRRRLPSGVIHEGSPVRNSLRTLRVPVYRYRAFGCDSNRLAFRGVSNEYVRTVRLAAIPLAYLGLGFHMWFSGGTWNRYLAVPWISERRKIS